VRRRSRARPWTIARAVASAHGDADARENDVRATAGAPRGRTTRAGERRARGAGERRAERRDDVDRDD
jgi:hypothetical protein